MQIRERCKFSFPANVGVKFNFIFKAHACNIKEITQAKREKSEKWEMKWEVESLFWHTRRKTQVYKWQSTDDGAD